MVDHSPRLKTQQNYYDIGNLYGVRDIQQYIALLTITHSERDSLFGDEKKYCNFNTI